MMETKLSVLFYSKTCKTTKDGLVPVYMRITINGARFEQSTQRYIMPSKWSAEAGKAKGNGEESRTINYYLDSLKQKVYEYQAEIIRGKMEFTIESFKRSWLGLTDQSYSILEVFSIHNAQLKTIDRNRLFKGNLWQISNDLRPYIELHKMEISNKGFRCWQVELPVYH